MKICRAGGIRYRTVLSIIIYYFALLFLNTQFVYGTEGTIIMSNDKTAVIPLLYGIVCAVSLILTACCCFVRKKDLRLIFLSLSIFLCNMGYFSLSVSRTLEEALLANRLSYFGSVFLILFMLLIIMDTCGVKPAKAITVLLTCMSMAVFFIAATGGYTDIYYKKVSLVIINGTAKLVKEYGPMHGVYYIYVFLYFIIMIGVILSSVLKKKTGVGKYAAFLAAAVLGNIGIWLSEQFLSENFEFLSISYAITEMLMLFMYSIMHDNDEAAGKAAVRTVSCHKDFPQMKLLTSREREVAVLLLEDRKRKEIAEELGITEHTVKKHTSNIFSKLGVGSRKELIRLFTEKSQLQK